MAIEAEVVPTVRRRATNDDAKIAAINATRDVLVAVLANPVTSTMSMWLINQALFKSGFYNSPARSDPDGAKTVNATAEWIGAFGVVEAAVVASKSINLPDLALKGISALALLK